MLISGGPAAGLGSGPDGPDIIGEISDFGFRASELRVGNPRSFRNGWCPVAGIVGASRRTEVQDPLGKASYGPGSRRRGMDPENGDHDPGLRKVSRLSQPGRMACIPTETVGTLSPSTLTPGSAG